ncbi:MAG: ABC transporter ATP-binding protein [Lachnospiraceae bacterium]|nr:ABC transporter ATP-binding protein [Lachnospiraceae bacterium]
MEYLQKIIRAMKDGTAKAFLEETRWVYAYMRRYWKSMILYTVVGMLNTVVSIATTFISRDLVDIITGHKTGAVIKYFTLMIIYGIISMIISQIVNYLSTIISLRVNQQISSEVFEKILMTDYESITKYHSGDLLTRWSSDTSTISNGVLNYIPNAIIAIFRFLSAFAVVVYNDWTFALFALGSFPVTVLMSRTLMRRMRNNNDRSAALSAKVSGFNQETFANIQTIKAFDLIGLYVAHLKQLQQDYMDMKLDFQRMSIGTSFIMSTVGLLVSYAAYGWGIYRVWSGSITYGTMTQFLSLSGTLTGALSSLTGLVPQAISLTTSARRLMDILEMPKEDYSGIEEAIEFGEEHGKQGLSLEVSDMSYAYHNATKVFANASMEAHPHEIVALVGPSGEGKTTMLRLILSVLRPQEGQLEVVADDGTAIEVAPYTRRFFSYVPQGNTMFSGTIAENMRNVKPDATDEEIIEVLKTACAWDFVQKLPEGINASIKERGGGFSEGQAQRLSIARALLLKAPILLLDEATSALDVKTEREVLKNIMQDDSPRTCIVTTHRPTVLTMCNRVYGIEEKQCKVLGEEEIRQLIDVF